MPAPQRGKSKTKDTAPDFIVVVDGDEYPIHLNEISAFDATGLRHATGMSVAGVLSQLFSDGGDADIDLVAALVWLSRRQQGEQPLSYEKVARGITYEAEYSVRPGTEDDDPGEAPAAD
jgi:hypothetical protein